MIYLLLSIICSTVISVVFRLFKDYEIDTFQAIIYNYMVCLIIGTAVMGQFPMQAATISEAWFPFAFGLGVVFIFTFVLIARTIQAFGISITTVMQRMSLIITVTFAIVYFQEAVTFFKILGIIVALTAVILASIHPKGDSSHFIKNKWSYFLPLAVLLLSGGIECILQFVQLKLLSNNIGQLQFTTILFGTAAIIGMALLIFHLLTRRMTFRWKHLLGGIALGIPNFGSIYFILKMLEIGWEASVVYPINNVGVIILATFVALWSFKEKLTKLNQLGILLAVLAIILIGYAQYLILKG